KCGAKGLQYMGLGIPTIMSPVGVNTEIIQDGENGFLASSDKEWVDKISRLIESSELREKLGQAGRETVVKHYSVEANKQRYLDLFI
ncbi:MAG: glycosyltransferase, partial [Bacteroidota bacterium]